MKLLEGFPCHPNDMDFRDLFGIPEAADRALETALKVWDHLPPMFRESKTREHLQYLTLKGATTLIHDEAVGAAFRSALNTVCELDLLTDSVMHAMGASNKEQARMIFTAFVNVTLVLVATQDGSMSPVECIKTATLAFLETHAEMEASLSDGGDMEAAMADFKEALMEWKMSGGGI